MSARLVLVVDVEGIDAATVDPESIGDDLLDHRYATLGGFPVSLVSAEWSPGAAAPAPEGADTDG